MGPSGDDFCLLHYVRGPSWKGCKAGRLDSWIWNHPRQHHSHVWGLMWLLAQTYTWPVHVAQFELPQSMAAGFREQASQGNKVEVHGIFMS
jgi:hypothetical protein